MYNCGVCVLYICRAFVAIFDFQERLSSKSGEISWKYFTGCSDGNSGYYCLRAVDFSSWAGFMPQLIAVAVTAGLHFWKGNTLLSVTGGTVCYMVLIRSVF